MSETHSIQMIGVGLPTLRDLRGGIISGAGEEGVQALREAGYSGGGAIHGAFEQWLSAINDQEEDDEPVASGRDAAQLTLSEFSGHAARFFRNAGWGEVQFSPGAEEGVAVLDIARCWESEASMTADHGGCHITTGMLAAFFEKLAGYPVAVLESECASSGGSRCRFLMGSAELMNHKWQELGSS